MTGCAPTAEERLTNRFEKFRSVLPPEIKLTFDNQEYETVVIKIDSLLTIDPKFASQWTDLKKSEAIELFSTREVIDYYVTYFSKDGGRR
jgi:hypothetical protein